MKIYDSFWEEEDMSVSRLIFSNLTSLKSLCILDVTISELLMLRPEDMDRLF